MAIFTKHRILMNAGLLLGLLLVGVSSTTASAVEGLQQADTESITLAPASQSLELSAGDTARKKLTIVNNGSAPASVILYARPYSVSDESYNPDFSSQPQNADVYKWVQFDSASYELKAGQTLEAPYTIRIPKDAAPGGHYGVLFVETQSSQAAEGASIQRKKRIGSIVYATVEGKVRLSGSLLETDVPFMQTAPPLIATQRIKNDGNTDFNVTSTVRARDIFGRLKYERDTEYQVLPSTIRKYDNEWVNPAWIGLYKVEINTKFLDTNDVTEKYVLLVPVWVYVLLVLLIGARVGYAVARRKK